MRSMGFRVAALAIVLLGIALLVPSSTPISLGESLAIGPFRLTAYGACAAVGALLAAMVMLWLGKRNNLPKGTAMAAVLYGTVGALLGSRIVYCAAMIESISVDFGLLFIVRLWEGGYTLFGGLWGGLAGIALYVRLTRQTAKPLLDIAAPAAALFLMMIRLGEAFTSQGLGFYVEQTAWQFFPFAVQDAYGYWNAPVYVFEAFAAFVIAAVCLRAALHSRPGMATALLFTLVSLSQILLDSWRHDEYIRFGFVHFNQLAAVATLAVLLLIRVFHRVKQSGWNAWHIIRSAAFAPLVGVLIWVEFALEKSDISNVILYCIMAAALCAMGVLVLHNGKDRERG
ncbi:MAG TPA: prolipoprotein diacylglyceryl transferase [Candidatus Limiplasma sp.]|nr:prolipoprotein diacylglyceryl transferase [Candidatus Limiplasma sp.]HRX09139.1 prolipoprotein diacylglyceryl transferase [Candidatus Limiplasma sp.]